ncbi:MAG: deoxyguanosinetriphosphate triphosphohydrolase [Lachnospirales bacterium]
MRKKIEERESIFLSKYATKSIDGLRKKEVPEDEYRTSFQIDRDKIYHSTAFRRLAHKTQVFTIPKNDHIRTRLTHTMEVSQIARSIATGIDANEDLTEAIALGHDLGHTAFGHSGEFVLNNILKDFGGFNHSEHSVKVVEFLEREGKGLNLTIQTIDGIKNHGTKSVPNTIEGEIVKLSDKVAYVNHDLEDSLTLGIIKEDDLKSLKLNYLGLDRKEYVNIIIKNVISQSQNTPHINIDKDIYDDIYNLRSFLIKNVYESTEKDVAYYKSEFILKSLFEHFMKNPDEMTSFFFKRFEDEHIKEIVICDYLASMTDRYAITLFESVFIPKPWE